MSIVGASGVVADDTRVVKGSVALPPGSYSLRDVVVSVDGVAGGGTRDAVIDQKDETFVPRVVAITVGGSVEFLNSDPVMHNVFSMSSVKRFDLGMFGKGETRKVTFDKPGVAPLRCNVHPKMEAFVVVRDNGYFSLLDDRGEFQIGGLPAGRYKLVAWHPDLPPAETWVNVDEAKLVTVQLKLHK
jgi:plastocyanin